MIRAIEYGKGRIPNTVTLLRCNGGKKNRPHTPYNIVPAHLYFPLSKYKVQSIKYKVLPYGSQSVLLR
jgi:hypothetical protein